jgi:hypothetical protein
MIILGVVTCVVQALAIGWMLQRVYEFGQYQGWLR